MPKPTISIVIPLYNKEQEVSRSIRSALAQTFENFEIIVVNDGSTDNGPAVVRSFNDPRIILINKQNAGVSVARNRGIAAAKTDLIAFLDADDEWTEDYLQTILRLVGNFPDAAVFATGYMFKQSGSHEHRAIVRGLPTDFSEGILENYFAVAAHSDPPLCSSSVTVRKKAIESVGGFPVGITAGEDLLVWARLAIKYRIAYAICPSAFFWMPLNNTDRPGRTPQKPDPVGKELSKLLKCVSETEAVSLRRYISLWHKMRANIFLEIGNRRAAFLEIQKAVRYAGLSVHLFVFGFLTLLPSKLGTSLFGAVKNMRGKLRNLIAGASNG